MRITAVQMSRVSGERKRKKMQKCVEDFQLALFNFGYESTADRLLKRVKLASSLTLIHV